MSLPAVEVALFPLKEGLYPDKDYSNPAGQEWRRLSRFLQGCDGVGGVWFGCQVEKPTWAVLMVAWEHINAHWDFQATP